MIKSSYCIIVWMFYSFRTHWKTSFLSNLDIWILFPFITPLFIFSVLLADTKTISVKKTQQQQKRNLCPRWCSLVQFFMSHTLDKYKKVTQQMKSIEHIHTKYFDWIFLLFSRSTNYLREILPLFISTCYLFYWQEMYKNSVFLIKRSGFFSPLEKHKFSFWKEEKKDTWLYSPAEKVFIIEEEQKKTQLQFIKRKWCYEYMNLRWDYFLLLYFFMKRRGLEKVGMAC